MQYYLLHDDCFFFLFAGQATFTSIKVSIGYKISFNPRN